MSYAKSFSIKKLIDGDISDEQKKLAYLIDAGVVLGTPRDTGRAQLNWIVSQGKPDLTELAEPGNSGTAAQTALAQANSEIKKTEPYSLTYIQNNLPYIGVLNDGHSVQAGSKYIEKVIFKAVKNGSN